MVWSLVSATELWPEAGALAVVLRGDLAAMLSVASGRKKAGASGSGAGVRNLHGLRVIWLRGQDLNL